MPRLGTPLKRSTRRILSIAAVLILFATFFTGLLGERFRFPTIFLLIPYFLIVVWLNRATGNIALAKERKLDERQRGLRDRTYRLTYTAFSLYAGFMLLVNIFGFGDLYIPFGGSNSTIMTLLLLANAQLVVASPILYVAWFEPDPPQEVQEETPHARA